MYEHSQSKDQEETTLLPPLDCFQLSRDVWASPSSWSRPTRRNAFWCRNLISIKVWAFFKIDLAWLSVLLKERSGGVNDVTFRSAWLLLFFFNVIGKICSNGIGNFLPYINILQRKWDFETLLTCWLWRVCCKEWNFWICRRQFCELILLQIMKPPIDLLWSHEIWVQIIFFL